MGQEFEMLREEILVVPTVHSSTTFTFPGGQITACGIQSRPEAVCNRHPRLSSCARFLIHFLLLERKPLS